MEQALLRDGHVALDLGVQQGTQVVHIHTIGKVHDLLDGEDGAVGEGGLLLSLHRNVDLLHPVLLQQHDVGVVVGDPQGDGVAAAGEGDGVIKGQGCFGQMDPDGVGLEKAGHLLLLGLRHHGNDLQHLVRVSRHQSGGDGGRDALQPAGVGDNDALHVFDQVAADLDGDSVRRAAQGPAGHRRAVGQGDGLGAAHGGDQLLPQDL